MGTKKTIALICGGESAEHAVSLESAKNVMDALNAAKYDVQVIAIDKTGVWRHVASRDVLRKTELSSPIDVTQAGPQVFLVPIERHVELVETVSGKRFGRVDAAFPILHGPYGEDGTMQGYLRLIGLPFVGPGVLGSAVGMDKDFTKRLLRDAGLPIGKFVALARHTTDAKAEFKNLEKELGLPFFIKPANMGSSVGVHKVKSESEFAAALKDAFLYDTKVLVEEFIQGREIECSVLGNKKMITSKPGEVMPQHEFYSYDAKYLDDNGARFEIPAQLPEPISNRVQDLALKVMKALGCEGMSRVDFFLKANGELLINEINTIPGFTRISMYPKMLGASGVGYADLIDRLLELAFERLEEEKSLKK